MPPTLVAFAVAIVDVRRVVSPEFKKAGSRVLLLPLPRDEEEMPDFAALKRNYARVHDLVRKKKILASCSLHLGGLAEAVSKMGFGNRLGLAFAEALTPGELFAPAIGSLVLEVPAGEDVATLFQGLAYRILGKTLPEPLIRVNGLELDLASLQEQWEKPLENIFPTRVEKSPLAPDPGYERPLSRERAAAADAAAPWPSRGCWSRFFPAPTTSTTWSGPSPGRRQARDLRLPQPQRRRHRGVHAPNWRRRSSARRSW